MPHVLMWLENYSDSVNLWMLRSTSEAPRQQVKENNWNHQRVYILKRDMKRVGCEKNTDVQ